MKRVREKGLSERKGLKLLEEELI